MCTCTEISGLPHCGYIRHNYIYQDWHLPVPNERGVDHVLAAILMTVACVNIVDVSILSRQTKVWGARKKESALT